MNKASVYDESMNLNQLIKDGYKRVSNRYKIVSKLIGSPEAQLAYFRSINVKVTERDLPNWTEWLLRCGDESIVHWIWYIPETDFKRFPLAR